MSGAEAVSEHRELPLEVAESRRSDVPAEVLSDGRVRFLVREDLENVDEDIVEYGDEDNPAILCTDQYTISDEVNEYDEINGHLIINHDKHYV